jgi:hypothetical protein
VLRPAGEEHPFGDGSLPRVYVGNDPDVADFFEGRRHVLNFALNKFSRKGAKAQRANKSTASFPKIGVSSNKGAKSGNRDLPKLCSLCCLLFSTAFYRPLRLSAFA